MKRFLLCLFLFLVSAAILTMCKKEVVEKMSAEELKTKYAIVLPDLIYEGDEPPTVLPNGKPSKTKKASEVTVTVEHDLDIDITGTTIVGEVSEEAYHASAQKFNDTTTNNGAVGLWECNRSYPPPGAGVGATTTCQTQGDAWYRVYSADYVTYKVHLSWFKRG